MRLIDADALFNWNGKKLSGAVKYGNKDAEQQNWSYSTLMMYEIADEIADAHTIEPVKRGEWIDGDVHAPNRSRKSAGDCFCNVCDGYMIWHSNFCPHCGANMKGDQE